MFQEYSERLQIGTMYYSGTGVEEDKDKAFFLFEQVISLFEDPSQNSNVRESIFRIYREEAGSGNERALSKLGDMYYFGRGTEVNYKKAVRWYEAGGEAGLSFFYKIGDMYRSGIGVDQDHKKARKCYEKGAVAGEVRAALALANMYFLGLGLEKAYKKHLEWLKEADSLLNESAYISFEQGTTD